MDTCSESYQAVLVVGAAPMIPLLQDGIQSLAQQHRQVCPANIGKHVITGYAG